MGAQLPPLDSGVLGETGYRAIATVGGGAHSTVYRATEESSGNEVAVKVLNGTLRTDQERLTFDREIEAMSRLSGHPNIIELLDSGFTNRQQPFIVMPFYPRGTYGQWVERDGPLDWTTLLDSGVKLSSAVEAVHRHGFVHRDIKPANIFLADTDDDPILADFGVSSFIAPGIDGPVTVIVSATPVFAAPEVLNGERPSTLTDVYSLGTVLYSLLEGRLAYTDRSMEVVVQQVTADEPAPTVSADVPEALRDLIAAMMSKRPEERPATAAEVAASLTAIQRDHGLKQTSFSGLPTEMSPDPAEPPVDPTPNLTPSDAPPAGRTGFNDRQTVIVEPINPPTTPLQRSPEPLGPLAAPPKPGMRWPAIIGGGALLIFVLLWVVTGEDPLGSGSDESDTRVGQPAVVDEWIGHDGPIDGVSWNQDGTRLATAGRDGNLRIWERTTDEAFVEQRTLELNDWVLDAEWSPTTPDRLALGDSGGSVTIWNPDSDRRFQLDTNFGVVERVAWNSQGELLAVGGDSGTVSIWAVDGNSAHQQQSFDVGSTVLAIAWSSDDRLVAAGGKAPSAVVWNRETVRTQLTIAADDWIRDIAWIEDDARLAWASSSNTLVLHDATTGEEVDRTSLPADPIAGLEWVGSTGTFIAGTEDDAIAAWRPGQEPFELGTAGAPPSAIALSPDSTAWAVGRIDGAVELWSLSEVDG